MRGQFETPKGSLVYLNNPICVLIVNRKWLLSVTFIYLYAWARSTIGKGNKYFFRSRKWVHLRENHRVYSKLKIPAYAYIYVTFMYNNCWCSPLTCFHWYQHTFSHLSLQSLLHSLLYCKRHRMVTMKLWDRFGSTLTVASSISCSTPMSSLKTLAYSLHRCSAVTAPSLVLWTCVASWMRADTSSSRGISNIFQTNGIVLIHYNEGCFKHRFINFNYGMTLYFHCWARLIILV